MRSRRAGAILILACSAATLLLWPGCRAEEPPLRQPMPPPTVGGVPLTPLERILKDKDPREYLLLVRLQLVAVLLPIGSVSDSQELWSYVNEEPAGAKVGASLSPNGIRVGFGRGGDWKDVERIIRRLTGQSVTRASMMPAPGTAMGWVLKQQQDTQTIFTYRRDRTLIGFDYPPGENVLMLTATLDYNDLSQVTLMGSPVVRSEYRRPRFTEEMGGYVLTAEPMHYALPDLGFQFKVPTGGFVVVGPGPDVRRESSPGRHFLVQERTGLKFETILIVWPEAFAAPVVHTK